MKHLEISGLYAITPDQTDTKILLGMTRQALAGGARLIQYRNKSADRELMCEQAFLLRRLCRNFNVPLIINDHLDLAIDVDADGVHVGEDDVSIAEARLRLGPKKIIGASCYNCLGLAVQAEKQGVDYVAFGAFFTSVTKPDAVTVSIDFLCQAKQQLLAPIVVIGGINLTNAEILISHGSDAIAVSNAVFNAQNIQPAAEQFSQMFC
tara:strand:+ start:1795 stop:2418 length:624 start_codon:yes stop_codon:yes gene_type:complete